MRPDKTYKLKIPSPAPSSAPGMYKIIALQDRKTPELLIAAIVAGIFSIPTSSARSLAREIQEKGNVCLGAFSQEVAEVKTALANDVSRHEGSPLRFELKLMK